MAIFVVYLLDSSIACHLFIWLEELMTLSYGWCDALDLVLFKGVGFSVVVFDR